MAANFEAVVDQIINMTIRDIEKRLQRPLSEHQKEVLSRPTSLMSVENMTMGFYLAKTDEEVEKWLSGLTSS